MIDKIVAKLEEANLAYRTGNEIMSDKEYDSLLELLYSYDPENEIFSKVGIEILDETRKSKLPIDMASMNKIKTIEDVRTWLRLKGINSNTEIVCTPKYDGLSLCHDEINTNTWTRGDGEFGQKSDEHYKLIQNHLSLKSEPFSYTYGEVIMPKQVFTDKYSVEFANPRNLVAGLLNSKEVTEPLKDLQFIKYGAIPNEGFNFKTKSDILDMLNSGQEVKVKYHLFIAKDITEDLLVELFKRWSTDYEIDGIILEVNDLNLQESLGRETSSNNPCYARAFKHDSFEQKAEATVLGISWNISKHGLLKPVLHITPIKLDGVTVSNVTGNNAKFVKDMGLGIGAKVVVKRSGMVIPLIVEVLETVEFQYPYLTDSNGEIDYTWNENGIELVTLTETDDQKLKQNIAFFEILEADNVSEGIITQLWDAGYQTIEDILNVSQSQLEKIDRFGKRKSQIVYNSIQKSIKDVQLSKLQHATGLFKGLGSLRLVKLEHFKTKPTVEEVMKIEGFAETSAKSYVESYDKFFDFIKNLPITIKENVEVGDSLNGKTFVFTGIRLPDVEKVILSNGGKIGTAISKNSSYLVMKSKNSGSSKEKKATDLGVEILEVDELNKLLKNLVV
jgi:NAD-dependent DNA ligase